MPRGFVRCIYVMDDGQEFQLLVDADAAEDMARGWVQVGSESRPYLPRGFLPRNVVGIDESGRQQRARVATTGAALWSGTATTWSVEGSDGQRHTATVVTYQQERQIGPNPFHP